MSGGFKMTARVDGQLGYDAARARAQLQTMRNLLADPARRAVKANARDANGLHAHWGSQEAVAWGIYGALYLATDADQDTARRNTDRHWLVTVLREQLPSQDLAITSADKVSHEKLLEFLDRAIAAA